MLQVFDKAIEFKKHVFLSHPMSEINSVYDCGFEKLIGNYQLQRFRSPVISTIRNGKFDEYVI